MSKAVILSLASWTAISLKIAKDYPRSVWLIREKMKEVLGFTVREHEQWFERDVDQRDFGYNTTYCERTIHLDFYNEPKKTMFLLRYGDFMFSGKTDS